MSNSDTGLNEILKDIGRTPKNPRRDSDILLAALKNIEETKKRLESGITYQSNFMLKDQAE